MVGPSVLPRIGEPYGHPSGIYEIASRLSCGRVTIDRPDRQTKNAINRNL